jgi:hypothetical protein
MKRFRLRVSFFLPVSRYFYERAVPLAQTSSCFPLSPVRPHAPSVETWMPKVQQFLFPLFKLDSALQIAEAVKDAQALKSATTDVQKLGANITAQSSAPLSVAIGHTWKKDLMFASGAIGDAVDTGAQVRGNPTLLLPPFGFVMEEV